MSVLKGKRILILEDEVLLALEAADTIAETGATVLGPAHRIDVALRLIHTDRPDAALLDVNINGVFSTEVAKCLAELRVPFVLATGYGAHSDVAGSFAIIDKPYNRGQIQSVFQRLFGENV
jgi:DNA-binding LytR/AlgR family response regulator